MAVNASEAAGQSGGLRELMREVRGLEKQLRQAPGWGAGIPPGGGAVLQELRAHGEQTVPQIGRRRGTSRQNIQVLVNRLKAEGWVELAPNPAHRRSELVRLTDQGRVVVEQMARAEAAFLEQLATQLPAPAVSAACGVLRQVRELIGGKAGREEVTLPKKERQPKAPVAAQEEKKPAAGGPSETAEGELPVSLL